jgi:hypothetical protein
MNNTKLFRAFKKLTKKEVKELGDFVKSPFFNANIDVIELYTVIAKLHPDFPPDKTTYEVIGKKLKGNLNGDKDYIFRNAFRLLDLLEQYIAWQWTNARPIIREVALLDWTHSDSQRQDYNTYQKNADSLLESSGMSALERYYWKYYTVYIHSAVKTSNSNTIDTLEFDLLNRHLESFYISNTLFFEVLHRNMTLSHKLNHGIASKWVEMKELAKGYKQEENPHIHLWIRVLQVYGNPTKEAYLDIKAHLLDLPKYISIIEQWNLFLILENLSPLVFDNPLEYYSNLYDLYSTQINRGSIIKRGKLNVHMFRNIVTVYIALGKVDEAATFINQYSKYLPLENLENDNVLEIVMAMILFEQGKYDGVQDHLNLVTMRNLNVKIDERRIRTKLYYQTAQIDLLIPLIASFRKFLSDHRDEISDPILRVHRNFINLVNELIHIRKGDDDKLTEILEKTNREPELTERSWLLNSIDKLRSKR